MPRWMRGCCVATGLWLGAGCGTDVILDAVHRSSAGESCETRADCERGLVCAELICRAEGAAPVTTDAGSGPPRPVETKSDNGESCTRRADCADGLACFEQVCRVDRAAMPVEGPRRGARGESCVASNDCERGLGCVGQRCLERDFQVPHVDNECHRVECVAQDDCCKDFAPEDTALCTELDQSCQTGVLSDCNLYASICTCSRVCEDSICVASVACANDLDCGGSGILRCFAGKCAQCAGDADCSGVAACVSGLCRAGCERNEQCPLFSVCEQHQCKHVGCQSDRDCFFESGSARSKCFAGACRTPCESDVACPLPFHACVEGLCTFVGCESDEECRAVLELAHQSVGDPDRAACRPPASEP